MIGSRRCASRDGYGLLGADASSMRLARRLTAAAVRSPAAALRALGVLGDGHGLRVGDSRAGLKRLSESKREQHELLGLSRSRASASPRLRARRSGARSAPRRLGASTAQPRLRSTPFHSLTSSANVAVAAVPRRRAPAAARRSRRRPRAPARRRDSTVKRSVLAFAHRPDVGERARRRPSARPAGCRARTARAAQAPRRAPCRAPRRRRSRRRAPPRPGPASSQHALGVGREARAANSSTARARSRGPRPRGGRRSAQQVLGARGQPAEQVERLDAAPRALPRRRRPARSARPGARCARPSREATMPITPACQSSPAST